MARSISRVVGMLALTAAAGSCQRGPTWNLASVEGTVTRAGRPLPGIQVTFRADVEAGTQGPRATGLTDAAGHYQLRTDTGDRGAAIGRYHVCLLVLRKRNDLRGRDRPRQANLPKEGRMAKPPVSGTVLPPAYSSFADTPLRVEVQPGEQVIDLEIP
jgi:hypothetical protein